MTILFAFPHGRGGDPFSYMYDLTPDPFKISYSYIRKISPGYFSINAEYLIFFKISQHTVLCFFMQLKSLRFSCVLFPCRIVFDWISYWSFFRLQLLFVVPYIVCAVFLRDCGECWVPSPGSRGPHHLRQRKGRLFIISNVLYWIMSESGYKKGKPFSKTKTEGFL